MIFISVGMLIFLFIFLAVNERIQDYLASQISLTQTAVQIAGLTAAASTSISRTSNAILQTHSASTLEAVQTLQLPSVPTSMPLPTNTALPPTATDTLVPPTLTSSPLPIRPTNTIFLPPDTRSPTTRPTATQIIRPTQIPTNVIRPTVANVCPGAPATYIQLGETVVVDFNDANSALRILTNSDGGAGDAIVQAYDNQRLEVVDGPECGTWLGAPVWYWYVRHVSSGKYGWAMEGRRGDRWLCNLSNPECGT